MLLAPGITQMLWPQYTTHGYFFVTCQLWLYRLPCLCGVKITLYCSCTLINTVPELVCPGRIVPGARTSLHSSPARIVVH